MKTYILSSKLRKVSTFCYRATFYLLASYLVFCLAIVFAIFKSWIEQDERYLDLAGYIFLPWLLTCILVMAYYAIGYVWLLWREGYKKEAMLGLITFVFLNILTGYIWFYWSEIRKQDIRFKLI